MLLISGMYIVFRNEGHLTKSVLPMSVGCIAKISIY